MATSHYLNQWWSRLLTYTQWVNGSLALRQASKIPWLVTWEYYYCWRDLCSHINPTHLTWQTFPNAALIDWILNDMVVIIKATFSIAILGYYLNQWWSVQVVAYCVPRPYIWTNDVAMVVRPLGTKFNEISIKMQWFSFRKMHLKILPTECWTFYLALIC